MSWQIQLNFNDGYPLNTDNTAFAPTLSAPYPTRVMRIDAEVNEGYPFNANNIVFAPSISAPYPYKVMRIDGVTNDGYPFLWWQYVAEPVVDRPDRPRMIRVFAPDATDFTDNGLRIIQPLSCTGVEELNGAYEAELEHHIDADGDWKTLTKHAILKIPVRYRDLMDYQLFRIYRVNSCMGSDGSMRRKVYARHIFYDLNDALLLDARPTDLDCAGAIGWLLGHTYTDVQVPDDVASQYNYMSDITGTSTAYYAGISVTAALIGADNAVINRWDGEIYRDNFYFSICSLREKTKTGAFNISYGVVMTEIDEDIDYTDYASCMIADAGDGHTLTLHDYDTSVSRPHHTTKYAKFSYDVFDAAVFAADAQAYFNGLKEPAVTYKVKFADLRKTDLYAGFLGLQNCEVGDFGVIRNGELGISTTQRILKREYDPLHDRAVSVELGNSARASIARDSPYSDTVSSGQSAADKQAAAILADITNVELQVLSVNLAGMQTGALSTLQRYTLSQLTGG